MKRRHHRTARCSDADQTRAAFRSDPCAPLSLVITRHYSCRVDRIDRFVAVSYSTCQPSEAVNLHVFGSGLPPFFKLNITPGVFRNFRDFTDRRPGRSGWSREGPLSVPDVEPGTNQNHGTGN